MLDETVETRRPWRGSPHPCVHAGVFLRFMGIISTVSKPLRYSHFGRVRVYPGARGLRPYVVALNVRIWVHLRILLDLLGSAYYIKYNDYSEPLRTKKARASCVFANVRGVVRDSYVIVRFNFKNTTGELAFSWLRVDW